MSSNPAAPGEFSVIPCGQFPSNDEEVATNESSNGRVPRLRISPQMLSSCSRNTKQETGRSSVATESAKAMELARTGETKRPLLTNVQINAMVSSLKGAGSV